MGSKIKKNIVSGFIGQLITLVLGLIVPRYFIKSYGSDVNGLLGTITQIFTYMALLESGIGQAAKNLLYEPFQKNDKQKISEISSIAKIYFRKFTLIYAIGVILLSFILPIALKTTVKYETIVIIVLLEGMSSVISFYYIETPSIIMNVDGKNYINNLIGVFNKIIVYLFKIIMAAFGLNIILLQIVSFIITIFKVFFYYVYFRKEYRWIKFKKPKGKLKLKDRNAYILTEIASTIFNSTDMIVLSFFISTKLSSVYGIYSMIYTNISLLLNSIYFSVIYVLGYAYHENIIRYQKLHDSFTSIFLGLVTIFMSVCYVLTIPFVSLYTNGITDTNYIYEQLPLMFCLIQMLSWSRYVSGNLTGVAGYAKQTSYISIVEAIINISLSILFSYKYGIIGVTLATVIALPIKVIWCTYIADKKVMKRSYKKSISIIGVNFLFFFLIVLIFDLYKPQITTYMQFVILGIFLTLLFGVANIILNFKVNKNCWYVIKKYIFKR